MAEKNAKGRTKGKMPMKDAAKQVLEEAGGPLHSKVITERAIADGLIKTSGETPDATMAAQLAVAAKKGDVFVRTVPGIYGLKGRDRKGQKAKEPEPVAA